jgi:sporulation protein YlmC with PRC-barrel domain
MSRILLAASLTLALAAPALAQSGGSAAVTRAGTGVAGEATRMAPDEMRASKIIGRNVYGPDDSSIGDVDDLVLDLDGRARQVVVSVGGFLGIGSKRVAVPMSELKWGDNDHLTLNLSKDQLASAPSYEYAERDIPTRSATSTPSGFGSSTK